MRIKWDGIPNNEAKYYTPSNIIITKAQRYILFKINVIEDLLNIMPTKKIHYNNLNV